MFLSLSFFLESSMALASSGRLSATGASSVVVDSMNVPRHHAAWRLGAKEDVVQLVTPVSSPSG